MIITFSGRNGKTAWFEQWVHEMWLFISFKANIIAIYHSLLISTITETSNKIVPFYCSYSQQIFSLYVWMHHFLSGVCDAEDIVLNLNSKPVIDFDLWIWNSRARKHFGQLI